MEQDAREPDEYDVKACAVGDLNEADRAACIGLVVGGHAVNPRTAKRDFPHALQVAIARKDGKVVGVGTIKPVRKEYAAHTAEESKFPFDPDTPEFGYVAVDPAHQGKGLSSEITEALSQHKGSLFARTSDPKMKSALKKAGFVQRGDEWDGQRGDRLSLWIRK